MKLIFFLCNLLLLLLFFSPSISAFPDDLPLLHHAKKLIGDLNLFPDVEINVIPGANFSLQSSKIVEKRLSFPNLVGDSDSEISVEDLGHYAGYYPIHHSHAARMFYFFFESRDKRKDDPVVIWLSGGPGTGGELALFYENGPFKIADDLSLVWNKYGWDKAFFAEHPQYAKNDFFITGESYAGHYIPAFATRVHRGNQANEGIHINLKGLAIGNGFTNPAIQYKSLPDYALEMGIIKKATHDRLNKLLVPLCELATKLCGTDGNISCLAANKVCDAIFSDIMSHAGGRNCYDIRKKCVGRICYDFSNLEKFLNQKTVQDSLGVKKTHFVFLSTKVHQALLADMARNLEVGIPALLEDGISLLVYAGEYDLLCNWLGNSRWVHAMKWSGQKEFVASPEVPFLVDGSEAGLLKSYGPLNFLKVHDAGHMVPMDQPKASLEMLKKWTQGTLAESRADVRSLIAEKISSIA